MKLDIVWLVSDLTLEAPVGVRKIYAGDWKKAVREIETAKVWIYNMPVPEYFVKRSGQIYIQTKHWASVTLKKFYLDAVTIQDVAENVQRWKYNSGIMDYILTGSAFDTESCRRGFGFDKEVIPCGSCRTDALFQGEKYKKKIDEYFQIEPDTRVMMYAPTYRFDKTSRTHRHESRETGLDFDLLKGTLEKKFGGKWCVMLRLHPSVANDGAKLAKKDFVINASDYPDSQELAAASDMMISDYSSIMFEPAFAGKPVFLYAADRKSYIGQEYDLLIDYDTLPFPIAETNEELAANICGFDREAYGRRLEAFMQKYGVREDGHASERAAEFILNLIKEKEGFMWQNQFP